MKYVGVLCLLLAGVTFGQATFDTAAPACGPAFPAPCGAVGDPEGVSWNGVISGAGALPSPIPATVEAGANGLGFPIAGIGQYARIHAAGPVAVPAGGPAPETGGAITNQIYIPIPPGATTVSFSWDFYNADSTLSAAFNDGMSIDVVPACAAASIGNLVYVDSFTPVSGLLVDAACAAVGGAGLGDVAPFGAPQMFAGPFPGGIPPFGSYLRVQVWNMGDNFFSCRGVIDQVCFDVAPCPPPPCSLSFTSPGGPGSLLVTHTPCAAAAGGSYFMAVTLAAGAFPAGWFFGLDITVPELVGQFTAGFPFTGLLDGTGAASFGPIGGIPSGITIYAVSTNWVTGFGTFISPRPAISYTIP